MSEYSVTFSVVTHNNEQFIGGLLDSIFENVQGVDYHIYVIDNCSTDKTLEIVKRKKCPQLTLVCNDKNIGFGSAHNQVLEKLASKYHVYINPDVIIKDDVIARISGYMDGHDEIGILTPKVLFPDGTIQILPKRDPKFIYLVSRRVNLRFLKKHREKYEMLEMGADQTCDIEFCTGAFMFARTELLKKAGGFDERYFLYFEDADLTRKMRALARAVYNPDYTVYHHWDRAGGKKLKFFFIQVVSMVKYIVKWRTPRGTDK